MAQADMLSNAARSAVAAKLASFFPPPARSRRTTAAGIPGPVLGESLVVCLLTAGQIQEPPTDLATLLEPKGNWLHLVRTAAGTSHFARTHAGGFRDDDQEVEFAGESPIAAKIEAAVNWIDGKVPEDSAVVRLLVIPAYLTHALAIVRPRKISAVLADQPPSYSHLRYEKEYPFAEFLRLLARETSNGMFSSRSS